MVKLLGVGIMIVGLKNYKMIRTKQIKRADLILCADMHIRETIPICRTDDYEQAQWKKLDFISELQRKHECSVLHAGDLFHHWKPSPELLSKTIQHLPKKFYSVYGNHDLPQHNMELISKCGLYTLEQAEKLNVPTFNKIFNIQLVSWNMLPFKNNDDILVWHVFTWIKKEPFPGCSQTTATCLLRKYPQYQLIVTGDNHRPFVEQYKGRLLVNPGSMMRMDANQETHRPRVYLWYAETNTVEPVYLPIEDNVISREHLDVIKARDERMEAFVSRLNLEGIYSVGDTIEERLRVFENLNKIHGSIMKIVYKSLDK